MEHALALIVLGAAIAGCGGGETCDPTQPDTICTIAGTGESGFGGDGSAATEARLYLPIDLAVAPGGELYVLDFNNYVVRVIDTNGSISTVIGSGEVGDSPDGTPAREALFNHASDLLFDGDYLYLAAWHNSRVKRVRLSDMVLENYAGRGRRTHYDGDGGAAIDASLDLPAAFARTPTGSLAIMDQGNQVIREVDRAGTIRTTVGKCIAEFEPCAPGEQPAACPGSEKLACSDHMYRCDSPCLPAYGGDDGPAIEARIGQSFGATAWPGGHLTYDPAGNLIFADTENHRIRKVDQAGVITTIAGTGERGSGGDGGPATAAQLENPFDLELGPDGTIYFTDMFNNCVRAIDPAGMISSVVGHCAPRTHGEPERSNGDGGSPREAVLDRPTGIELVGDVLYIADTFANRIRAANVRAAPRRPVSGSR